MMHRVLTLLPLLYYQKATNSAVKKNIESEINNWNDSSKPFSELVKSYTNFCSQYDLLTWVINRFKIKVTGNCFNLIWG